MCVCVWVYVCLYIYIYIFVIHRQTVLLYHKSSEWLDTLDASSWDENPTNVRLITYRSGISVTYVSLGI